ncbi:LOB domain-containing protein 22-like [Pyrus x bretschneideri]|uniref:LOB domain-containing protein 22-like n=1 Tax=Pyrus x bretschneideri TaxID=225117 RepID=UPI00202FB325|nr:LOB domain-containing protein 22-like [Pyrus x bretschneideri]
MTNPQSCAACKNQRKKCTVDCPLAPYFPSSYPTNFHNAHKLFGVSRVVDSTNSSPPSLPTPAMSTIFVEADHRAKDPVGGCHAVVRSLLWSIHRHQAELDSVRYQLELLRSGGNVMAIAQTLEDFKDNVGTWNVYDHMQFHQVQKNCSQEQEDQGNIGGGVAPQPQEEQANVF